MKNSKIPIFFCFDKNYAAHAAVATYAAVKNSKSKLFINWVFTQDCAATSQELKKYFHNQHVEIHLIQADLAEMSKWKISHHFSTASYLRLLAEQLFPQEEKVIYLDCDALTVGDITALYDIDLGSNFLAGVVDLGGESSSKLPRAVNDRYINTGVLIMNIPALRKNNFLHSCQKIYHQYKDQITWLDQCILNKFAEDKKLLLKEKFNRQIFPQQVTAINLKKLIDNNHSTIVHFLGSVKPWQSWCNPYVVELWFKYARDLGIQDYTPTPISRLDQAISLANVQHLNADYERSSQLKSQIIDNLIKHLDA